MSILPPLRKVVLESPFQASQGYTREQHETYMLHCTADCYARGESPFASHHVGAKVLNDDNPRERAIGIESGWPWGETADAIVVYTDFGISEGMALSIAHYEKLGKPIERRTLPRPIVDDIIRSGAV